MARIKAFEVPNISSFKNFKRKQKTASFSFVYFWLDFLFTGKQKKILKVLMAQIKVFWSFQHVLSLKNSSESKKEPEIGFVWFLEISCLQVNKRR